MLWSRAQLFLTNPRKIKNTCKNAQIICKMNDASHDFNFQKEI